MVYRDQLLASSGCLHIQVPNTGCQIYLDGKRAQSNVLTIGMTTPMLKVRLRVTSGGRTLFDRVVILNIGTTTTIDIPEKQTPPRLREYPQLRRYIKNMRPIPGASFMMGRDTGNVNERPRHRVTLSPFYIGAHPVTEKMFDEYLDATNADVGKLEFNGASSTPSFEPDSPVWDYSVVDFVGLDGISGYCGWATKVSGIQFDLPTEAQWEYSASGGKSTNLYPWGSKFIKRFVPIVHDVITFPSVHRTDRTDPDNPMYTNKFGLSDLIGIIRYACSDFSANYTKEQVLNPSGPANGSRWVTRGIGKTDSSRSRYETPLDYTVTRRDCDYGYIGFQLCTSDILSMRNLK